MTRTRVLIVDDSALMRELLGEILGRASDIEVVGAARDPIQAQTMLQATRPDIMTLDVEMPKCDGLTFLGELMRSHPLPVVMVSSLTERGSDLALRALELGAVDVVEKPKFDLRAGVMLRADELVSKVRAAARARPRIGAARRVLPAPGGAESGRMVRARPSGAQPAATLRGSPYAGRLIAIGASTGGTEALAELLSDMPADAPPILIVQHMPERFTAKFAARLNGLCRIRVAEAKDGDAIQAGTALLAPGGLHLCVVAGSGGYVARLRREPENVAHRPSVDVLFDSVTQLRSQALGVILTGMGADGARGLLAMRQAGARTFAQDEASCVVFGMPKEAILRGAAEQVLPLSSLAQSVLRAASTRASLVKR